MATISVRMLANNIVRDLKLRAARNYRSLEVRCVTFWATQ